MSIILAPFVQETVSNKDGLGDHNMVGSHMSFRILKRYGQSNKTLSRDVTLGRILKRNGQMDKILIRDGQLERILKRDGQLDRIVKQDGQLKSILKIDGQITIFLQRLAFR